MPTTSPRRNTEYITLLNVIAAISVVILHTNGRFWTYSNDKWWGGGANVIESVFYFAVPVFFMNTGATLIDYRDRYSTKQYAIKRINKTFLPFAAWSVIALVAGSLIGGSRYRSAREVASALLSGRVVSIYWFFPALFGVYLCIPLFASVEKSRRRNVFSFLAAAGFILNCLVPFAVSLTGTDFHFPVTVGVVSEYLLYVVIGYLLRNYETPKPLKVTIFVLGIAGLAAHIAGTLVLSRRAGEIVSTFKGYNNLPCVLYSVAVWLFFRDVGGRIMNTRLARPVRFLGGYTFGIYLTHIFAKRLLNIVLEHFGLLSLTNTTVYALGAPLVIIPACVLGIWLIRKVPGLRRIVP